MEYYVAVKTKENALYILIMHYYQDVILSAKSKIHNNVHAWPFVKEKRQGKYIHTL